MVMKRMNITYEEKKSKAIDVAVVSDRMGIIC